MAYRTFNDEKTYAAPEIDILPKTIALLQTAQQTRQRQQQQRQSLAAQFKADQYEGKYNVDQSKLSALSQHITNKAQQDILRYGQVQQDTLETMGRATSYSAASKTQYQTEKDMLTQTEKIQMGGANGKNYYDPTYDRDRIIAAGREGDVDYNNRGEVQSQILPTIGKNYLSSYRIGDKVSDYVKERGDQIRSSDNTFLNGVQDKTTIKGSFFDKNGKEGVRPEDAIVFLKDPHVAEYYKQAADEQLMTVVQGIKADSRATPELKRLPDEQVVSLIRNDREFRRKNGIDITPGEIEVKLAQKDLEDANKISIDNSHSVKDYNPASQYGVTIKGGTASPIFNNGVGIQYGKENGKKITLPVKSKNSINTVTGEVMGNDETRDMQLESAVIIPIKKDGTPLNIQASNQEELIRKLATLPQSEKDQIAGTTLGLAGTTYNKATSLDAANVKRKKLEAEALTGATETERIEAERQAKVLDDLLLTIQMGDQDVNTELMQALLGKDIVSHVIVPSSNMNKDEFNIASLATATGSNLSNRKNWTPEMRQMEKSVNDLVSENAAQNERNKFVNTTQENAAKTKVKTKTAPVTIKPTAIKEIKRSSLADRAKAANFDNVKEYEEMVKKNGITIVD